MFGQTLAMIGAIGAAALAPAAPAVRHEPTGVVFPGEVGEFRRVTFIKYDDAGDDVSAGYNLPIVASGIAITVYVFPAPPTALVEDGGCASVFEQVKGEIVAAHPTARPVGESPAPAQAGAAFAQQATYEFTDNFAGARQDLRSTVLFYCPLAGRWLVQYRATWPVEVDGAAAFERFRAGWAWAIPARP